MLFKGRDGVLVRDRCILLCEQATQSMLKPHLPDSNEIKLSQQNITCACDFPNLSDRNMNVAIDSHSSDSAQSKDELVRKYPVCVDISRQTKNDDQKLSNNNAGQFCMSENAYVNLVRNDTAHSISQTRINKNVNANSSKHLVACPFLLKKRHCLKGSRCVFSHNISQSRTSKKASVNPLKEATEVSNDVVYPTTLNDSSVSTNSSAPK